MRAKVKKILQKKLSGEMYIDLMVTVLVFVMVLVITIVVLPVFLYKANLNTYADKVLRVAELSGSTSSAEVIGKISAMKDSTGITPENISWDGTAYTGSGRVQLGEEITITVKSTYDVSFGIFGSFTVPLTGKAKGSSEIYWK